MENQIFYHPSGWMPAPHVDAADPNVASGPGAPMGYFPPDFPALDAAAWQHTAALPPPFYYAGPNDLSYAAHLQPQPFAPLHQTHTNVGWAATDVPATQADYKPMNTGSFGGQWASPFAAAAPPPQQAPAPPADLYDSTLSTPWPYFDQQAGVGQSYAPAAGANAHGGQLAASFGGPYPVQPADPQADHIPFAHDLGYHDAAGAAASSFVPAAQPVPSPPPPYTVAAPANAPAVAGPSNSQVTHAATTGSRREIRISKAACTKALSLVQTEAGTGGGACPIPGCGAVLGAHLRRHILSHGPAGRHCRFPGCEKVFVRLDVAKRHELNVHKLDLP
ncbi:hypothetical protein AURDEDRAFT_122321 [Auricularia subglabra TFB-10046 SS5]|nr:hypothetical protein AURDEDRAFT_122321 [Auricularia subglabra TFB-10046 SS5]